MGRKKREKAEDWKSRLDEAHRKEKTTRNKDEQEAIRIDIARRSVKFYLLTVLQSKRKGYITSHFIQGYGIDGIRASIDRVKPLEKVRDTTDEKKWYTKVEKDFDELIEFLENS